MDLKSNSTSPFSHYLHTNHAATDEEKKELKVFLNNASSRLAELDQEITAAKAHYDGLVEEYKLYSTQVAEHKALMAPIRYLPVDILQEIFLRCLPTTHDAIISAKFPPVMLTHVCSDWRRIALATAALWSSIHIVFPYVFGPGPEGGAVLRLLERVTEEQASVIAEWLSRSGSCPLSITIQNGSPHDSVVNRIIDVLIPFHSQWGALTLNSWAGHFARIMCIPSSQLTSLYSLDFCGTLDPMTPVESTNSSTSHVERWSDSGLLRAPKLKQIVYRDVMEDVTKFPLQWQSITSLKLFHSSFLDSDITQAELTKRVASILCNCPLLQEFLVEFPFEQRLDGFPDNIGLPPVINLNHLTSLQIISHVTPFLWDFFDTLNLPCLKHLSFDISVSVLDFNISASPLFPRLSSFLVPRLPALHSLLINQYLFGEKEFLSILSQCNRLEILTLNNLIYKFNRPQIDYFYYYSPETSNLPEVLNDTVFRRLFGPMPIENNGQDQRVSPEVILPFLRKLEYEKWGTSQLSDECAIQTIKDRNAVAVTPGSGISKLVDVAVVCTGVKKSEEAASAIAELELDGVRCNIKYTRGLSAGVRCHPTEGIPGFPHAPYLQM